MTRRAGFLGQMIHGLVALVALAASVLWSFPAGIERDAREGSEPRVTLGGDQAVRPGEVVELRWTRADRVTELEILLSEDGGRTYATCISPELEPSLCRFSWRVPAKVGEDLRLRIRYNRGGREIEGPPTKSLALGMTPSPESTPLGLPPAPASESSSRPTSAAVAVSEQSLETQDSLHRSRQAVDSSARSLLSLRTRNPHRSRPKSPVSFPLRA
jgi:hypothetical protein